MTSNTSSTSPELESYYRQPELWEIDRYEASPDQRMRARLVAAMVPDDARSVLDVGCGNGFVTRRLQAEHIVGLDPSPEALEHFDGEKVCASAEEIPFDENSFDAVVCCEVLEHLPQPTLGRVVSEIGRVARNAIVIGVPFDQDLRQGMMQCGDCGCKYHVDLHCNRFRSAKAVADLFPGWQVGAETKLGTQKRIRSNAFRTLRYWLQGPFGSSTFARCPECGSDQARDSRVIRPLRAKLFDGLAWRMPKKQLAQWIVVGLAKQEAVQ